jgi:hypothetical protein
MRPRKRNEVGAQGTTEHQGIKPRNKNDQRKFESSYKNILKA